MRDLDHVLHQLWRDLAGGRLRIPPRHGAHDERSHDMVEALDGNVEEQPAKKRPERWDSSEPPLPVEGNRLRSDSAYSNSPPKRSCSNGRCGSSTIPGAAFTRARRCGAHHAFVVNSVIAKRAARRIQIPHCRTGWPPSDLPFPNRPCAQNIVFHTHALHITQTKNSAGGGSADPTEGDASMDTLLAAAGGRGLRGARLGEHQGPPQHRRASVRRRHEAELSFGRVRGGGV